MPLENDHWDRSLEALMIAWRRRNANLPPGVLVSIFADLIAQADANAPDVRITTEDVVVDLHGIAKIESPSITRASIPQLVSLFASVLGHEPPKWEGEITRARVVSWVRSILGPAAKRDRVLLAFDPMRWPELVSSSPTVEVWAEPFPRPQGPARSPTLPVAIRHKVERPLHPVCVPHAPAARPNTRPVHGGPIELGNEERRRALIFGLVLSGMVLFTAYTVLGLLGLIG